MYEIHIYFTTFIQLKLHNPLLTTVLSFLFQFGRSVSRTMLMKTRRRKMMMRKKKKKMMVKINMEYQFLCLEAIRFEQRISSVLSNKCP